LTGEDSSPTNRGKKKENDSFSRRRREREWGKKTSSKKSRSPFCLATVKKKGGKASLNRGKKEGARENNRGRECSN